MMMQNDSVNPTWQNEMMNRLVSTKEPLYYTVSQKNVTVLSHYNSNLHELILIIFGINITEKIGNEKVLYFHTLPN